MTSAKAIAANRRNARRCTGPRTAAGKRKAAGNALQHGVLASLDGDPTMSIAAARIAAALAGPHASPRLRALVVPIAEAQADLLRIRSARARMIDLAEASLTAGVERESAAIAQSLPTLVQLDRYERSAMRRRHRAMRELRKCFAIGSK
jgi:hypothetical protein